MELKTWMTKERGRGLALAKHLKEHPPIVSDWASGKRAIPVGRGAPIEAFTSGEVSRQDMFPDKWQEYWPELANPPEPAPAPPPPDQPATELAALPTRHQQPGVTALADRRLQIGV